MTNLSGVDEKIKVLLISSNLHLALSIKTYFKKYNDEIEYLGWAKTSQEGISRAKHLNPHIVLITSSHEMDTKEVVRLIRASSESIKIMTMSESNNPKWIMNTIATGADDYICQPSAGNGVEDYTLLGNMYDAIKKLYYHQGNSLREEMSKKGLR